jgi:hypothetical protein
MMVKPSFTQVRLVNGKLRVKGLSSDDPLPIDIRVYLEQGDLTPEGLAAGGPIKTAFGSTGKPDTSWEAQLEAPDFTTGLAQASAVEVRLGAFTAITWTQPVVIQ